MSQTIAQPIPPQSYADVFDMAEERRISYMKSLGAKNLDPPLPRSSHLRNKVNGRVLPWDEMLAEQRDIMECCDANGNTDPAAWLSSVDTSEHNPEERAELMVQAQAQVLAQATATQDIYRQPNTRGEYAPDGGFPAGVVTYDDIETTTEQDMNNLISMVSN